MQRDEAALPKSEEALKEIIEEYEGKTRRLTGGWGLLVTALAVAMSLYHLYSATVPFIRQIHLTRHLMFVLVLSFLLYPGTRRSLQRTAPAPWDVALAVASIASLGYILVDFEAFIYRSYIPTTLDMTFGIITILLGIAGALLAGFLGQMLNIDSAMNGAGFIGAIVGAFLILLIYRLVLSRRR